MTVSLFEELGFAPLPKHAQAAERRLQILVLEDNETDRTRLKRVIFQSGLIADVTEAEDIDSFRTCLRAQAYDIVFIDFWLDFESGIDALHLLLAEPGQERAMPIMLSRAVAPDVIIEAMRAGCADYIVKDDLNVAALRTCIGGAFERRVLVGATREDRELRRAIRRFVERLGKGQVPGLAEPSASFTPSQPPTGGLSAQAAKRLSSGFLADLELLWQLRRQGPS